MSSTSAGRAYESWKNDVPPPTDGQMKTIIIDRLHTNPLTKDDDIQVDVKQSVVILGGAVSSVQSKRAAGDEASSTPGVVDVRNELETDGPVQP